MRIEDEIKQNKFRDTHQKAFLNLLFTSKFIETKGKNAMKTFGVTMQQYNVLRILKGKHPALRSAEEIKEVMIDKSPDLTRLVDKLIEKKFVTREVCKENRLGLAQIAKLEPTLTAFHNDLKKITNKEAEELSRILDKMRG